MTFCVPNENVFLCNDDDDDGRRSVGPFNRKSGRFGQRQATYKQRVSKRFRLKVLAA